MAPSTHAVVDADIELVRFSGQPVHCPHGFFWTMKRLAPLLLIALLFLTGCETLQAISGGEVVGKGRASNYSYGVPDRYRAGYE